MIRGIYIAASGLLAESARQDVVANNLANATTAGFKGAEAVSRPFGDMLLSSQGATNRAGIGTLSMGSEVSAVQRIEGQGPVRHTGNALDLALVGDGYLTVDTPAGRRYTRDGSLGIDDTGRLVTAEGNAVLGTGGAPIRLDRGEVAIATDGTVTQGTAVRGRLMLTALDPGTVVREGANLLAGTPAGAAQPTVRQSHLEGSTVNVVSEMVELIRVMRSFEAGQKAVQSHDEALQGSITKVGGAG
ncbi:flagellar hook-basal body protein [Miltoncostaea marina]|uniref:flagellar hook-basal body protein n=1 Tax=Miltoncostaea marina TaxID=2843215 RepID=UPI001C3DF4F8|nr:flagellar hook-basal body protein [Miltoncostaea marina]